MSGRKPHAPQAVARVPRARVRRRERGAPRPRYFFTAGSIQTTTTTWASPIIGASTRQSIPPTSSSGVRQTSGLSTIGLRARPFIPSSRRTWPRFWGASSTETTRTSWAVCGDRDRVRFGSYVWPFTDVRTGYFTMALLTAVHIALRIPQTWCPCPRACSSAGL
jgi:hypothetical protein